MKTKFIFVTGGVVSGLGKGICGASLGRLLKQRGLRVTMQKLDPYFNVDPGTMSPYQHGEVFVTDDGAETDLDLGHYERFIDESLTGRSSVSSGELYWSVLNRERRGDYLGGTVQIIPHITDEIKKRIYSVAEGAPDIAIVEIGGTVGDIESQPYLESLRQMAGELGRERVLFIHVSLIVTIPGSNELKSKPTQHSVKELRAAGIQPDILICRTDSPLSDELKQKLSMFCNIEGDSVIENRTASTLYEVPLMLAQQELDQVVCRKLALTVPPADLTEWRSMVAAQKNAVHQVTIALVGKYTALHDAYLSVVEAIHHAAAENSAVTEIRWIDSEGLTWETTADILKDCDGILVPGGFGNRGIEGMLCAIRYAREEGVPFLGICLGMQMAVVEFARNVAGLTGAHSTEFFPDSPHPVIDLMEGQRGLSAKGGTMRLGSYPCILREGSRAHALYGMQEIQERHRHRYEFSGDYARRLEAAGLTHSGTSPDGGLVEMVELSDHPWFMGVQFHPEFKSRPNKAHPVFCGFVVGALTHRT